MKFLFRILTFGLLFFVFSACYRKTLPENIHTLSLVNSIAILRISDFSKPEIVYYNDDIPMEDYYDEYYDDEDNQLNFNVKLLNNEVLVYDYSSVQLNMPSSVIRNFSFDLDSSDMFGKKDVFHFKNLKFALNYSNVILNDIQADTIRLHMQGKSYFIIDKGRSKLFSITASGNSQFVSHSFSAKNFYIDLMDSARATISYFDEVRGRISGNSELIIDSADTSKVHIVVNDNAKIIFKN